jgi:flagellar assembly protein FliH
MTISSEAAQPVALDELEQLGPAPTQDPAEAAEAVVEAARAEADALRASAVEDGFAEGLRRGREETAASLVPAADALREALIEAMSARDQILDGVEMCAAQLAISIAEKIVVGALEVSPERVVDVVRGALRGLLGSERIIVCVHPEDIDLVRAAGLEHADAHIEIYAERRVPRGGALVRTAMGEVDGRIETKLEAVRTLVAAELRA